MIKDSRNVIKLNKEKQKKYIKYKLHVMKYVFIFILLFLSSKVLYIKVVDGKKYEIKAVENIVYHGNTNRVIKPNRGSILDRNKHNLASSRTVYDLVLDVKVLVQSKQEEIQRTLDILNQTLDISMDELEKIIEDSPENKLLNSNYHILMKAIERDVADDLRNKKAKAVYLIEDTKRSYVNNNMAAQLIGFMRSDYKWGLEKKYDDYLVGVQGRSFRLASDLQEAETKIVSPKQGDSIITTIDTKIQKFAEAAVESAGIEYEPLNASVIVMNPNTGEILGYAQYPSFDLNSPSNVSNSNHEILKKNWDLIDTQQQVTHLNSLWKDFNISSTFELGSIYKPIVVAAALEEGIIDENSTFYCGGAKYYGMTRISCWNEKGHGVQTLEQVLANSCNVAMMDIVEKLGYEKYYKYQKDFGFGEKTDIDLPFEQSAETLINQIEDLKNPVYLATNSMGQGFNATAIQAITAFAATINGGNLVRPYVVSQIVDKDGRIKESFRPSVVRKIISKETSDELRHLMKAVVSEKGTGSRAEIKGYNIGGKTGTGQQGKRSDNKVTVSFIGYLTVDKPEVLAISIINQPKDFVEGSTSAAPMLREVLYNIIKYYKIQPSDDVEFDYDIYDTNTVELPDFTGKNLKEVSNTLNEYGVDYEFVGSIGDSIKSQIPIAGTKITRDSKIYLYMKDTQFTENLIKLPNVVGMNIELALDTLKEHGFEARVYDAEYSESVKLDYAYNNVEKNFQIQDEKNKVVVTQMPSFDIQIPEGTIVKLKVR